MERFRGGGPRITLIELMVIISILAIFVALVNGALNRNQNQSSPFSPGILETRCEFCQGSGVRRSVNAQGHPENVRCPSCNGTGRIR